MLRHIKGFWTRFESDERGVVAVLFGIMFMVLILMTGVAIDHDRIVHSQSKLTAAADAAALAAGRALLDGRLDDSDVEDVARRYFNENASSSGQFSEVRDVRVTINRARGTVTVDVDAEMPLSVTRVAGFTSFDVPVTSATSFDQRDIELGMALDITGSMAGSKIADLKSAAKDLVDILLAEAGSTNKVRIGLAPYAASVNAGSYARTVTDGASGACVHERSGSEAFTDATPESGQWLGYTRGMSCPSARVMPLTTDKSALKSRIDTFTAAGTTAGHLGASWAWYLVSPEWASIWPSESEPVEYGEPNTIKAIVLMTDGVFNQQYVSSNGSSSTQARNVCQEMKDMNVVVYAVAFQAPSDAAALLRECASSEEHYFNAADGEELREAFQSIATRLNNLRLTI